MPTYQYQCSNCSHELEEFQSMSEPPLVRCPNCGKDTLLRVLGAGAGVIFKGSGFYLTDYKKSSASPAAPASGPEKKGESAGKEKGKPSAGKEGATPAPPPEKK